MCGMSGKTLTDARYSGVGATRLADWPSESMVAAGDSKKEGARDAARNQNSVTHYSCDAGSNDLDTTPLLRRVTDRRSLAEVSLGCPSLLYSLKSVFLCQKRITICQNDVVANTAIEVHQRTLEIDRPRGE